MAAMPLPAGFMLRGYRIVRPISRGGFGVTYLAEDSDAEAATRPWGRPDRLVAIKEYLPLQGAQRTETSAVEPADDSRETVEMFSWGFAKFTDEARLLARVSSKQDPSRPGQLAPNFAHVGASFEENNTAYIVMEYISGGSLRAQLDRIPAMNEEGLRPLLRQLLNALAVVHEDGVWHRDIKPQNILLRMPPGVEEPPNTLDERARNRVMPLLLNRPDVCPVLIDFGSARVRPSYEGASVSMVGTEGYAPAEQFEGRQVGPWSDIYAVSAVAYRALTGRTPTPAHQRQTAFLRTGYDPLEPAQRAARASGSAGFLMALDWGLWIEPELRPQTLDEWRPVLLEGAPSSRAVRDQFLIGALVDREADGTDGPVELPIVEEATGDLEQAKKHGLVDDPAKLDADAHEGAKQDSEEQGQDHKRRVSPQPIWKRYRPVAAAAAAILVAFVAFKMLTPKPTPPGPDPRPNPVHGDDALQGTVLASQTLTGADWVSADVTQALAGSIPRWISLEADAPVRVRAGGKVYLVDKAGIRMPDLSEGKIQVKPVAVATPTHLEIRAGKPPE